MSEALHRDYEVGPELGRGRFGTVRRCASRTTGEILAVKSLDKARLAADPLDRLCLANEAKLTHLAADGNPAVVSLHAAYEDDHSLHLVLDLCPGCDLFDLISTRAPLPEPEAAALLAQIAGALAACHRRGVAHRDVKPDNLLFDAEGRLRLADFGSAEWFGDGRAMTGVVGTPYYVAPEVIAGGEYGEKVDVWSCGVILYIMLSGMPPFYGDSAAEIFAAVLRGSLRFPPRLFHGISPAAKDLIRRMLCKEASRRISAEQILRHPWITCGGGAGSVGEPT